MPPSFMRLASLEATSAAASTNIRWMSRSDGDTGPPLIVLSKTML